jgi:ribosome-associated toxin RatA of RatAB toxin-antitoxin module
MRNPLPPAGVAPAACLALLLGAGLPARAASPIALQVERAGAQLQVRATVDAQAPAELCYAVIADFDRLAEFIPDLQSSRIVSSAGQPLRLRQVGETRLGLSKYAVDVTLAVTVDPPRRIDFRRVDGNLVLMEGSWQVGGDARRCTVDYHADLQPSFWIPPLVGPLIVRRQVERQLAGLLAEIERRARSTAAAAPRQSASESQ